jgi:hypothetical protein
VSVTASPASAGRAAFVSIKILEISSFFEQFDRYDQTAQPAAALISGDLIFPETNYDDGDISRSLAVKRRISSCALWLKHPCSSATPPKFGAMPSVRNSFHGLRATQTLVMSYRVVAATEKCGGQDGATASEAAQGLSIFAH